MLAEPEEPDRIERSCDEVALIEERLDLDGKDLLDLGCGRAERTRALARAGANRRFLALEVDESQHALNLAAPPLPNLRFGLGGAEAIPAGDASFDGAFLFRSLHHVPIERMDRGLAEIRRVLVPGGFAWISEPLYRGELNEILRLFHDEREARRAAFEAVERSVRSGALELVSRTFFLAPVRYEGFEEFERLVIHATHSTHVLSEEIRAAVEERFQRHVVDGRARFESPVRVDLLRRPEAP